MTIQSIKINTASTDGTVRGGYRLAAAILSAFAMPMVGAAGVRPPRNGAGEQTLMAGRDLSEEINDFTEGPVGILDGTPASPSEARYLVVIGDGKDASTGGRCAGTLITPNAVLTEASCFSDIGGNFIPRDWVEINRRDLTDDNEDVDRIRLCKKEGSTKCRHNHGIVVRHPGFYYDSSSGTYTSNLAVIHLPAPVDIDGITPVTLNNNTDIPAAEGEELLVYGWGMEDYDNVTDTGNGTFPDIPLVGTVEYFPNDVCLETGDFPPFTDKEMCTGTPPVGPCIGDGGGPLMTVSGDVQVGVISNYNCEGLAIYERVSSYYEWITEEASSPPSRSSKSGKSSKAEKPTSSKSAKSVDEEGTSAKTGMETELEGITGSMSMLFSDTGSKSMSMYLKGGEEFGRRA